MITIFQLLVAGVLCTGHPLAYAVMDELFAPGVGTNFSVCRTPIGASDFALKYYSYNDTAGDLSMEHFSIENDRGTLIPLIRDALKRNPSLKIWASPWCPPSWMKVNRHYASQPIRGMAARRGSLKLDKSRCASQLRHTPIKQRYEKFTRCDRFF